MNVSFDLGRVTFKVKAHARSRLWWGVVLTETVEDLRVLLASMGLPELFQVGACMELTPNDYRAAGKGMLGLVFLPRERVEPGLVAHELAHAAHITLQRTGVKASRRARARKTWERGCPLAEEHYSEVLGDLTMTFWRTYYGLGYDRRA